MSTLTLSAVRQNLSKFDYAGLGLPAMVLLIMAMLVVPLPPLLLDILFTFNIGCSLLVIMIAIGTRKPLEFSSFPSCQRKYKIEKIIRCSKINMSANGKGN